MTFAEYIRSFADAWWRITLLGEPALLIPVAIIIVVWLWGSCSKRAALLWGSLLALGGTLLVVQKLLYYITGAALGSIKLYTISGHSTTSTYIYGSLVIILAHSWPRPVRRIAGVLTMCLVLAIAVSRVAVAGHRVAEAIAGLLIGMALLFVFLRYVWRKENSRYPVWTLALPCALSMMLTYGHVIEFERIFRMAGRWARPDAVFYK